MKTADDITVLICVHSTNYEYDRLLLRALDSLVNQTYKRFDVVLVLDECWEYTEAAINGHKQALDLQVYKRDRKEGLAAAKNFGISKCKGNWIGYLDADDAYAPDKLKTQRDFLLEHDEIDVCGTLAWDVYNLTELKPSCFQPGQYQTHEQIAARLPVENVMAHGSVLLRKIALKAVNYYPTDKRFLGCEDWALWLILLQHGYRFHNIPQRLYLYSMNTSVPR
jgi:glycosyltransferase involved in cell wall biosynthesis